MSDDEDFDGFQPLQQSPAYAAAVRALGARVAWHDPGAGPPVLVVERGRLRLVQRADPGRGAAGRRTLRRLARWPGVTIATPETAQHGWGLVPLVTPVHQAVWRIDGNLRAGMAGKWRNRLVRAERLVQPETGDAATLDQLLIAEAEQRARRGYRALPAAFARALPPCALRLWQWREGGEMAAAMAFVVHGASASYHLAWASGAARAAGAHGVMLVRAAEALAAEGVRWLDLGPVDTEAAPGLARFKLGTGARLRRLGATCLVLP
jgi:hypothetical protein